MRFSSRSAGTRACHSSSLQSLLSASFSKSQAVCSPLAMEMLPPGSVPGVFTSRSLNCNSLCISVPPFKAQVLEDLVLWLRVDFDLKVLRVCLVAASSLQCDCAGDLQTLGFLLRIKDIGCQAWWLIPAIPTLKKQRQKNHTFQAN